MLVVPLSSVHKLPNILWPLPVLDRKIKVRQNFQYMVDALAKPAHVFTWESSTIYDVRALSGYSVSHMKQLSIIIIIFMICS